ALHAQQLITPEACSPTYRRPGRVVTDPEKSGYGGFKDTPEVREGWDATRAVAESMGARVIVFQTPASFGPTESNRTAVYRFFESIRTESVKAIELRGPWATHIVDRICQDVGLLTAVAPFDQWP